MKTKYVVVLTVELEERQTKKSVREWIEDVLGDKIDQAMVARVRVRSVDED